MDEREGTGLDATNQWSVQKQDGSPEGSGQISGDYRTEAPGRPEAFTTAVRVNRQNCGE